MELWKGAVAESTLPAKELERAKNFYSEHLGLEAISENETGVHYIANLGCARAAWFKDSKDNLLGVAEPAKPTGTLHPASGVDA